MSITFYVICSLLLLPSRNGTNHKHISYQKTEKTVMEDKCTIHRRDLDSQSHRRSQRWETALRISQLFCMKVQLYKDKKHTRQFSRENSWSFKNQQNVFLNNLIRFGPLSWDWSRGASWYCRFWTYFDLWNTLYKHLRSFETQKFSGASPPNPLANRA